MMPFTLSRGMLVVPLKFMCSTQCETPVRPGRSSFDPTLYQHHTDASGAVCISCTSTVRPLSSTTRRNAEGEVRVSSSEAIQIIRGILSLTARPGRAWAQIAELASFRVRVRERRMLAAGIAADGSGKEPGDEKTGMLGRQSACRCALTAQRLRSRRDVPADQSGERVRGDIFDMDAQGVVFSINGTERASNTDGDCRDRLRRRRAQLPQQRSLTAAGSACSVCGDGSLVSGRLEDIGGTTRCASTFNRRRPRLTRPTTCAHLLLAIRRWRRRCRPRRLPRLGRDHACSGQPAVDSTGITVLQGEPVTFIRRAKSN